MPPKTPKTPLKSATFTPDTIELTINKGGIFAANNGRVCSLLQARRLVNQYNEAVELQATVQKAYNRIDAIKVAVSVYLNDDYDISLNVDIGDETSDNNSLAVGCQSLNTKSIRGLDRILRHFGV